MNFSIGIFQGRLSKTKNGILQRFPKKWENEFFMAKKAGFSFIEYYLEEKFNRKNPFWSIHGRKKINNLIKQNELENYTISFNFLIINSLTDIKTNKILKNAIYNSKELKIKKIILPLENASQLNETNYIKFAKKITSICKYLGKKQYLLLETNVSANLILKLLNYIKNKKVGICYDIGNRSTKKNFRYNEIAKLSKHIYHIHLKDKSKLNKNVLFGNGLVNFRKFFLILRKINYDNNFTIESVRGRSILNVSKKNLLYFKNIIKKSLIRT